MEIKTIVAAPDDRMQALEAIAADFMFKIYDFMPGDYWITDESSLLDFTDFGSSDDTADWQLITETYGITKQDVPSNLLVDIFAEIKLRQQVH